MPIFKLYPSDDSSAYAIAPDSNQGSSSVLMAGFDQGVTRFYMKFDLTGIGNVAKATLYLALHKFYGLNSDLHRMHLVNSDWNEKTLTWNTQPQYEATEFFAFPNEYFGQMNVVFPIDITDLVKSWVSGVTPNCGVMVESDGNTGYSHFFSKDFYQEANRPYLEVVTEEIPAYGSVESHTYMRYLDGSDEEINAILEIFRDDIKIGEWTTPVKVELDPGVYLLKATYGGQTLTIPGVGIEQGKIIRKDFRFLEAFGILDCYAYADSQEVRARVDIENKHTGKKETYFTYFRTNLPVGEYKLTATYSDQISEADISIGQNQVIRQDFLFSLPEIPPPPENRTALILIPIFAIVMLLSL